MRTIEPIDSAEYDPPSGQVHTCDTCGKQEPWLPPWQWYGSWQDYDDSKPIFKACSPGCMKKREEITEKRRIERSIENAKSEEQRLESELAKKRAWREQVEAKLSPSADVSKGKNDG